MGYNTKKSIKFSIMPFVFASAIILVLIYSVGFENIFRVIAYASPVGLISAVFIYSISWILRAVRLESLCKNVGAHVGIKELFKIYISGNALNVILPAKLGDAAVMGYLKMHGISIGMSAAITVQCRILDVIALVLFTLPSAILLFPEALPEWIRFIIIASALIVLLPIAIVLLSRCMGSENILKMIPELKTKSKHLHLFAEKAKEAYFGYLKIASEKQLFSFTLLISLFIWLLDILTCYEVSLAIGVQVPTSVAVLAVSLANIGKSAPATPGSIGIYESILAAILALFGISMQLAVPIAILDHAIKNLFTLALGVPATMSQGLSLYELVRSYEAQKH